MLPPMRNLTPPVDIIVRRIEELYKKCVLDTSYKPKRYILGRETWNSLMNENSAYDTYKQITYQTGTLGQLSGMFFRGIPVTIAKRANLIRAVRENPKWIIPRFFPLLNDIDPLGLRSNGYYSKTLKSRSGPGVKPISGRLPVYFNKNNDAFDALTLALGNFKKSDITIKHIEHARDTNQNGI